MTRARYRIERLRRALASALGRESGTGGQPAAREAAATQAAHRDAEAREEAARQEVGRRIDSAQQRLKSTIPPPEEDE
jgi:hypothetical protein